MEPTWSRRSHRALQGMRLAGFALITVMAAEEALSRARRHSARSMSMWWYGVERRQLQGQRRAQATRLARRIPRR